jgi:hypothetical protein
MTRPTPPPITLNADGQNLNRDVTSVGAGRESGDTSPSRNRPLSRVLTPQSPTPNWPITGAPYSVYQSQSPDDSTDLLVPPPQIKRHSSYLDSPISSSRRSSWSTDAGPGDFSRYGPFVSPFDDSRAPSRSGSPSPAEPLGMKNIQEKYNITPSAGLLLYPNDKEDDDIFHDPATGMEDDRECDIFTKRGLVNIGGLAFITAGILLIFIGYPVLCVSLAIFADRPQVSALTAISMTGRLCETLLQKNN